MSNIVIPSFILTALLIGISPAQAQSESSILGTVAARADGSILPEATATLSGGALAEPVTARTGADGRFVFSRLVPGEYRLEVAREGFRSGRFTVALKPRAAFALRAELELGVVAETVDVRAAALANAHAPGSTTLDAARLDRLPQTQRANLPDLIVTAAPGMIRGHDDFVHIRGSEVALNPFINGVSFWENPHTLFSPGLGADYIASMNVMTGGFSAEYGNRFGGVLDIVTKSGFTMDDEGSITAGAGSALRHNAAVEFGGHAGSFAYYVNAAAHESARFLSPPDPRSIHNTGRGARSFVQLEFAPGRNDTVKLVLMGDGANFQIPKTAEDDELRPNLNAFQRTRSQSLILSWDHAHSSDTLVQTAFYQKWSQTRLLPHDDPLGAQADAERRLNTYGVKFDATRFLGRHTLKGGVDLVRLRPEEKFYYLSQPWITYTHLVGAPHIHFRGPNQGPGVPRPVIFEDRRTGGQASLYLQDKIQLTPALTADVGLRYDAYDLATSASHFSPRVNLAYRFDSGTVLHGSYNHFFVPPPVENILMNSAGLTAAISEIGEPLPPLRPVVEDQAELGVVQPLGGGVQAGLTGYYRLSDNPVHTVLFPDVRIYGYANFDQAKAYGLEFKVETPEIGTSGVSGYLNYALGRVWFFNPITAGFTTEAGHIHETSRFLAPMDQTHTLTSGLTYRLGRTGLWGALTFEYGSGTPMGHGGGGHTHEPGEADHEHGHAAAGAERVPGHFVQNLSLGWDALRGGDTPRLSFQFNVENLSNHVYVIAQESVFTPGQYSIPRLYAGSIKVRF